MIFVAGGPGASLRNGKKFQTSLLRTPTFCGSRQNSVRESDVDRAASLNIHPAPSAAEGSQLHWPSSFRSRMLQQPQSPRARNVMRAGSLVCGKLSKMAHVFVPALYAMLTFSLSCSSSICRSSSRIGRLRACSSCVPTTLRSCAIRNLTLTLRAARAMPQVGGIRSSRARPRCLRAPRVLHYRCILTNRRE